MKTRDVYNYWHLKSSDVTQKNKLSTRDAFPGQCERVQLSFVCLCLFRCWDGEEKLMQQRGQSSAIRRRAHLNDSRNPSVAGKRKKEIIVRSIPCSPFSPVKHITAHRMTFSLPLDCTAFPFQEGFCFWIFAPQGISLYSSSCSNILRACQAGFCFYCLKTGSRRIANPTQQQHSWPIFIQSRMYLPIAEHQFEGCRSMLKSEHSRDKCQYQNLSP